MKKDEFKEFVKNNPKLINFVKTGDMTWQKFYEMYDLYGEDETVWKDYISKEKIDNNAAKAAAGFSIGEFIKWLKSVDLDGLQEGIGNVQRVLGVVQDFSKKDNKEASKQTYKPRPLYKHFED